MDHSKKLAIFKAQTENVRSLQSSVKQVRRAINTALRCNDRASIVALTKVYAVLFCAWAEANLGKVIHTPHGFDIEEIEQVQTAKKNGISSAWKKAAELGLRHLSAARGSFKPNARLKLDRFIDKYVFDPSLLRNKLAHGQWTIALNRDNDDLQHDLTKLIADLTIVKIDSWMEGHQKLSQLIETLIESPKKTFVRDWYAVVSELEDQVSLVTQRTMAAHIAIITRKKTPTSPIF